MANGRRNGYGYRYPAQKNTSSAPLIAVAIMAAAALVLTVVIAVNQSRLNDKIIVQQVQACLDRDEIHRVVSDALKASLTEEDVQANKPQKEAYEKVITKFAEPEKCWQLK